MLPDRVLLLNQPVDTHILTLLHNDICGVGQACIEATATWCSCAAGNAAASIALALSCSSKTSILAACRSTASGALVTAACSS